MKPTEFDPKTGSLELSFSDGTSFSIDLRKNYHREEAFYVDLFWEEFKAGTTLSLALHPKADELTISSCKLVWPLAQDISRTLVTQGFATPSLDQQLGQSMVSKAPSFWEKRALKKLNTYDPLPHPSVAKSSYQAIISHSKQQAFSIRSTDESAALTIFSLSQNGSSLSAKNQSEGYQLRHSFPAFELEFSASTSRVKKPKASRKPIVSIAVSPVWEEDSTLAKLTQSALFEEGNINSIVLQNHESPFPGQTNFDERLYSAFAKTCLQADVYAGVSLSPFVIATDASTAELKIVKQPQFKRWSPSLGKWVYPIDLSDDDSMRSCEQHLLRYFRLGFRFFILHDITCSLRDGEGSTTTGQQLSQRLDLLRRILPGATVLLADLCASDAFAGFQGFCASGPYRTQLPMIARYAGLGIPSPVHGELAPFRIPTVDFAPPIDTEPAEVHRVLDLSHRSLSAQTWIALESTIASANYPA